MVRDSKALRLIIIAVVCAVVTVHWPTLSAKALSFDDQQYLTANQLVRCPGWKSAKIFLTEVLEPSTVGGYYQPLAMISLMVDYAAGGNENNLRPFHITSLAFHTANTALVIVLLYMLCENIWAAAAAGLLFGVHPMTVEPIPWVGERKTLLAAFFALWSLILYIRYSRGGGWKSYAGCFLMYLLALMSKPTSVPLPAVMLLMDYWPLKKISLKSIWEKLPLFALGAASAIVTYISQHRTAGTMTPVQYGPWHIPLMLCHNIIFYLYKMVLPINLSSHYPFPKPLDLSQPMVLAGVIGTCIFIPLLFISLRWTRAVSTGWLIFFVAIFPTMGVVGFTNVIASDKYAYLPAIGILMVVTAFLIWVGRNKKIAIALAVLVLMLAGAEAVATRRYLVYWKDTITLNKYMLQLAPDTPSLYVNLSCGYIRANRLTEALEALNRAMPITPNDPSIFYNFGVIYYKLGRNQDAITAYKRTINIKPNYADAYYNLGLALDKLGRYHDAIQAYEQAIRIRPYDAEAYCNLASAYGHLGQLQKEIEACEHALEINPNLAEANYNLGTAFGRLGRYKEAIKACKKAIKIKPDYVEAHYNLGAAFIMAGDKNAALLQYEVLKTLDPNAADKLRSLIKD